MKARWFVVALLVVILAALDGFAVSADGRGSKTILGQTYTLKNGERLGDDLVLIGSTAVLQAGSIVDGNVAIIGGTATLAGTIKGDVVVGGGTVELAATALVEGDLVTFGTIRRHPDATVKGNLVEGAEASARLRDLPSTITDHVRPALPSRPAGSPVGGGLARTVGSMATLVAILVAAALLLALLPDHLGRVSRMMTGNPWASVGAGFLTALVAVVITPILVIICIGIPVAIVLGVGLILGTILGWVAAGHIVGQRLVQQLRIRDASPLLEILAGTLLLGILTMVPCVGALLAILVGAWGLGAAVLTRFGTRDYLAGATWLSPAPPHAPQPPAPPSPDDVAPLAPEPGTRRDTRRLSATDLDVREEPAGSSGQ